jgi:hypothetical protein
LSSDVNSCRLLWPDNSKSRWRFHSQNCFIKKPQKKCEYYITLSLQQFVITIIRVYTDLKFSNSMTFPWFFSIFQKKNNLSNQLSKKTKNREILTQIMLGSNNFALMIEHNTNQKFSNEYCNFQKNIKNWLFFPDFSIWFYFPWLFSVLTCHVTKNNFVTLFFISLHYSF